MRRGVGSFEPFDVFDHALSLPRLLSICRSRNISGLMDALMSLLLGNQRGPATEPLTLQIDGRWRD
ncbi:MAG: hypothetical protein WD708_06850 [Kiritimatiellia bacterium]